MVPLMMLLVLCDVGGHGDTLPKRICCISIQLSLPKECSDIIHDALVLCDTATDPCCYIIFFWFEYDIMEQISNSPIILKLVIFFLLYKYVTKRYT